MQKPVKNEQICVEEDSKGAQNALFKWTQMMTYQD